jgi:hypothetical protein
VSEFQLGTDACATLNRSGDPGFVEVEQHSLCATQKRSAGKCGALFFASTGIRHERFGLSKSTGNRMGAIARSMVSRSSRVNSEKVREHAVEETAERTLNRSRTSND